MKVLFNCWRGASVLLFAVVMFCSCADGGGNESRRLVATIEPLRAVAAEIAGSDWQVSALVPQGFSPEDYSPTAAQMAEVAEARYLIKVGRLGFETVWLPKAKSATPALSVVDSSEGISEAAFDPHTWTSPHNIKQIARNIARALSEADSANASAYARRLSRIEASADSVDNAVRELLAQTRARTFIITHPALTHFAARYGLRQLAIEPDGKEPTPASVQALISEAKASGVQVIFVQQEFSDRSALMIAEQTGANIVSINPLSADWQGELLRIAQALRDGK